jgi:hypothetical protein
LCDLPNGTTLAQEIVASLIVSITKIIVIEDYKLDNTFLYVTFGSQALISIEGPEKATKGG